MVSMLQLRYRTLFIPELGAEVGNRYNNMMYVQYKEKSAKSQQER